MDLFAQLQDSLRSSYVLEREIGRGGMATVYLARDINHDGRSTPNALTAPVLEGVVTPDGKTVVFAAAIALSPAPTVSRRDTVATGPYASWRFHPLYDIAPDGRRLLLLEPSQRDLPATVILNWANAFAARIGSNGARP